MTAASMMNAFRVAGFGQPPAIERVPVLPPRSGEVKVRISACGLNFADLLMAQGRYQETPPPPFTLGLELAGVVEALGPDTKGPPPGARVAVFSGQGGLAEFGCFPVERCVAIPDAMTFAEAAGFQVAYGTSHVALDHRAGLRPGETLLVLGAAGGVGLTAVEVGKSMGARVIAVARGEEKLAIARAAGADHVLDAGADIRAEVLALGGADVIYDPVGGDLFTQALRAARPEARVLVIGFASGKVPEIKANHLLVKNVTLIGLYWGGYLSFRPEVLTDSLKTLFASYARGELKPHVSHTLPLSRAADGLELLETRRATGKVVITMP